MGAMPPQETEESRLEKRRINILESIDCGDIPKAGMILVLLGLKPATDVSHF